MELSLSLIAVAVVATVGVVQWLKGFFPGAPTWPWRALMPVVAIAWGIAIGQTWLTRALSAALIVSMCEAGYAVIVQGLTAVASSLLERLKR